MKPRLRALILAAGRGERLRPLTDTTPKLLLPVVGEPVALRTLRALAALGCEAVAFNLFHLGEQIAERFGRRHDGMRLEYSREPRLLGTLGALWPLREFLGAADRVLIVNGDSACDWPLAALLARHHERRATATLLLTARASLREFGGGIGTDRRGRVTKLRGERFGRLAAERVFAGAHVLEPALLRRVPEGPGDILEGLYLPLLREGVHLETLTTRRRWHDLGTPRRYLEAVLAEALGGRRMGWCGPQTVVAAGARVRHSVLEAGVRIGPGARVERAVLLEGAGVGSGAVVRDAVLGPGTQVPADTEIREQVAVRTVRGGMRVTGLDPAPRL